MNKPQEEEPETPAKNAYLLGLGKEKTEVSKNKRVESHPKTKIRWEKELTAGPLTGTKGKVEEMRGGEGGECRRKSRPHFAGGGT